MCMGRALILSRMPPRETIDVLDSHQFDVSALVRYLRTQMSDVHPPFYVRQFRGGHPTPAYSIDASTRRLVLRRKPPGPLLPSAHAIEREYQVMTALHGTRVPVPKTHLLCEDADIIGTPFFVMDYVESHPMTAAPLPDRAPDDRRTIYHSMSETLARLHNVDWRAAGLGDF